jgi:hypothetical protein
MAKLNCWEIKKCGREVGGIKVKDLGVCIAATEVRTNGIHNGKSGGRVCYALAGTLCGGKVQGTFATKLQNCMQCDVYKQVIKEEGSNHKPTQEILKLITPK